MSIPYHQPALLTSLSPIEKSVVSSLPSLDLIPPLSLPLSLNIDKSSTTSENPIHTHFQEALSFAIDEELIPSLTHGSHFLTETAEKPSSDESLPSLASSHPKWLLYSLPLFLHIERHV